MSLGLEADTASALLIQGDRSVRLRESLRGIRASLAGLREMDVVAQMFEAAAQSAVRRCGFDRAILFAVSGSELVAQSSYFGSDAAWAARALAVGQQPSGRPQLGDFIVETEMVRRRAAALVLDAQSDPHTPRALVEETGTRSYVAAPIVCADRVVAFIHADHYFKATDVDEVDREVLATFALGLGLVLDGLVARRHMERLQTRLRGLARDVDTVAAGATTMDLNLVSLSTHGGGTATPEHRVHPPAGGSVLSPREREVLDLLVTGATNATIARRLFIAESTAKAHVRHILKKLNATNRAEAVAKYLRTQ